jgi:hypothetical protein
MKKFNVTLDLYFCHTYRDEDDYSDDESDKESVDSNVSEASKASGESEAPHVGFPSVEEYIKATFTATDMTEFLIDEIDTNIISAEWDKEAFKLHLVVETKKTAEELHQNLLDNSLEDTEYEACQNTGWILFTSKGNEFGLTDYRNAEIEITPVKPKRVLTEEHKAKMKAGRIAAKARRDAEKAQAPK